MSKLPWWSGTAIGYLWVLFVIWAGTWSNHMYNWQQKWFHFPLFLTFAVVAFLGLVICSRITFHNDERKPRRYGHGR